jgi:tetratricopeptide (TPR) repeat protein
MTPQRWRQIEDLYHAARERGRAVLQETDPDLRREVERVLAQDSAEAYLRAHRGPEAAAEFQKVLVHRGIVFADPIDTLARLQLGRAYLLSGDTAKARASYQDFLTLWKDADPEIPILTEAKAEYAKLQ